MPEVKLLLDMNDRKIAFPWGNSFFALRDRKHFLNDTKQPWFGSRTYPAPISQIRVALGDVALGRNITGRPVTVGGNKNEAVGAHSLGSKLKLDIRFTRQEQPLSNPEIQTGNRELLAGLQPFAPTQTHCSQTLLEWRCSRL